MLSYRTIEPNTLELLNKLSQLSILSDMRLVGGTSLALQYGHRKSVDLDFFGILDCEVEELEDELMSLGDVCRHRITKTIRIYKINGVKVDFVDYRRYSWIDKCVCEDNIRLASPKDIAAMKINAIEGRGSKKDFIDIYYLLKHFSINELLDFYKQKYPEYSHFRALMSLTYFDDAELQPMPFMFDSIQWDQIKQDIIKAVEKLSPID